mgnify:FL=1
MGELEQKNKEVIRRTRLQEAILGAVFSGRQIEAAALIPEVLNYFLKLDLPSYSRRHEVVSSTATRLRKRGLLKFENGRYSLTSTGEKIWNRWQMADYQIKQPKKWDKKWRVIIFDIPEKKRDVRKEVRMILTQAGFQRLQDSVWVFPYDCEDVIGLMKTNLGIGRYLLYLIVDQLENDRFLRMDFGLI